MPYEHHAMLHAGLSAVLISIEAAGATAADQLNIPLGRRRNPVITQLGRSELGRAGIAGAISALYAIAPDFGTRPVSIVFELERGRFEAGHRHPLCQ